MKKRLLYALVAFSAAGSVAPAAWFLLLRPRPARLSFTPRPGDDTVVINQVRRTRLSALVIDQYGRRMRADTSVRYQWIAGDSLALSSNGSLQCADRRDMTVRATLGPLIKDVVLRCRPVASIEAASWLDLVAGDSTRDLSFVAHGPDGETVTELRGAVTIGDRSIIDARGTTVRPQTAGQTVAIIQVGNVETHIPIVVYQPVTSFVENARKVRLMAMRVSLTRGDTMSVAVPKAAFWVTYFSKDPHAAPPTIELVGDGTCTTGNGLQARRIEDGEYAKYCLAGNGTRMRIAHGAAGAERVNGVVAIRMMW